MIHNRFANPDDLDRQVERELGRLLTARRLQRLGQDDTMTDTMAGITTCGTGGALAEVADRPCGVAFESDGAVRRDSAGIARPDGSAVPRLNGNAIPRLNGAGQRPYPGLRPYRFEEAKLFFGRERACRDACEQLIARAAEGRAFLLILGAVGSGKSSLIHAGLLPRLTRPGAVSGVGNWLRCGFNPRLGLEGGDLFPGLARALTAPGVLPGLAARTGTSTLIRLLRDAPRQAAAEITAALTAQDDEHGSRRLILVVDPLEHLFAGDAVTVAERCRLISLLTTLADHEDGRIWVIAALRDECVTHCSALPGLLELIAGDGTYHLAPASRAELQRAVTMPARIAGVDFETHPDSGGRLDIVIAEAAARHPMTLPAMAVALRELHQRDVIDGRGGVLRFETYQAIGEIEAALAISAETACRRLGAAVRELPAVLRSLFYLDGSGLCLPVAAMRDIRAWDDERRAVVAGLTMAGLLIEEEGDDGGTDASGEYVRRSNVRLAHASLLTLWPRLRETVETQAELARIRERVRRSYTEWRARGCQPEALLPPGKRLADAQFLLAARDDESDDVMRSYVLLSAEAAHWMECHPIRRARLIAAAMAVVAVVAAGIAGFYWRESGNRLESLAPVSMTEGVQPPQATGGMPSILSQIERPLSRIEAQAPP